MVGAQRILRTCWFGAAVAGLVIVAACSSGTRVRVVKRAAIPTTTQATSPPPAPATFPLTGLAVDDKGKAARPALSVKVDNAPGAFPQAGLNDADIVTEELVEGDLTRLMATFESHDSALVGPIRSARPVDADLLRELGGGIFTYSGAAAGEVAPVKDHSTATLLSYDDNHDGFQRLRGRPAPHHVFASTADLYRVGAKRGAQTTPPPQLFRYGAAGPGQPATNVVVPMSSQLIATWGWNATTRRYERNQGGRPDTLIDGSVVSTTNIVVLSVEIRGTGIFDAAHNEDPLVVVIGSGPAWVVRDGQVVSCQWQRPNYATPMRLMDANGADVNLQTGTTWLELLPRGRQPAFS